MGHSYHIVYAFDLLSPRNPWDAALLGSDSYEQMCTDRQEQSIEAIDFPSGQDTFRLRHGRKKLSGRERQSCADGIATSPPVTKKFSITFALRGERFEIADTSAKALELFRLR